MEDLKERVSNKALSKLIGISRELNRLDAELDNPPYGLSSEQVQIMIDSQLREQEVWRFILNNAS